MDPENFNFSKGWDKDLQKELDRILQKIATALAISESELNAKPTTGASLAESLNRSWINKYSPEVEHHEEE